MNNQNTNEQLRDCLLSCWDALPEHVQNEIAYILDKDANTHKIQPSHSEIIKYIEDNGLGGDAIQPDGNPTSETYEDARQELIDLNN